jgi:cardiolipin synthase A/B
MLASAFRAAARRGIDLRILVPEKSNHRLADLARGTYLREIQSLGGQVLLYSGGMVHAKAAVVDDNVVYIGSANLDLRSFFLNYEVALFAYGPEIVGETEAWIGRLFAGCKGRMDPPGIIKETLEGAVRMLDPLM